MADTNLSHASTGTSKLFKEQPLALLEDYADIPYTYCNDTFVDPPPPLYLLFHLYLIVLLFQGRHY